MITFLMYYKNIWYEYFKYFIHIYVNCKVRTNMEYPLKMIFYERNMLEFNNM
jgi:hypothetical protein